MRQSTIATFTIAIAFTMLALTVPGEAEAQELQLETSITTEYAPARSFDALSNGNTNSAAVVKAAYGLDPYLPFDGLRAYLEINGTGVGQERFDGAYELDWSRGMYLAGADFGPTFWGFFHPFVRVTFGYVRQQMRLTPDGSDSTFSQREHDFATKDSVGLELHLPYNEDESSGGPGISTSFTLGLSGQLGYIWHTPAKFDDLQQPKGVYADNGDLWARSGIDAGRLDSTGLFWDLGLFARFKF